MNGSEWHKKRKVVAPAFSSRHIKRMNRVALDKTEEWIKNTLLDSTRTTESFDVSTEMIGIVLSALSETAFEYDMSSEEKQLFGDELKLALKEFCVKAPVIPLRKYFGWFIPERRRAMAAATKLRQLTKKIMDEHWKKDPSLISNGTIIQIIMESDHAFPTEEQKVAQLLEFLVGFYCIVIVSHERPSKSHMSRLWKRVLL